MATNAITTTAPGRAGVRSYRESSLSPAAPLQSSATGPAESGLLRAARLRWSAHWTERADEAELRILKSRTRLAEERKRLAETELEARRQLAHAARLAEEEETERSLRLRLRGVERDDARRILEREVETSALLLEREVLRYQGQTVPLGAAAANQKLLPPPDAADALEVHVSDEQIESLAVQAMARLGQMSPQEAEQAWSDWRQEILRRLPAYAAAETIRRADHYRRLVR